eukprot:gene11079-18688_t
MKAEQDENEMLQGVDWEVVSLQTDHTTELDKFLRESSPTLGIKNFINAYSCNWISACCSSNSSLKKKKKAKSSSAGFDDDDDPENMSAPELETIARGSVNYERRGSLKQPLTAVSGPNFGEAGGVKGAGTTGIVVFREEELVVDPQQRQHAKKKSPGLKTIQSIARSRSHRHLGDPIPAKSSVFARMKNHLGGKGKSAEVESKATIKSGDLEGKAIAYHKQGSLRRGRKSSNTNAVLGRQSDGGAAGTDASVRPSLRQKSVLVAAMPRYPAGEPSDTALLSPSEPSEAAILSLSTAHASAEDTAEHGAANGEQSEAALLSPSAAHASAEDTAEHGAANGANVSANVTLEMAPLGNGAENGTGTITLEMAPLGNGAKNGTGTITLEMAPLGNGAKNGTGTITLEMAPLGNGAKNGTGTITLEMAPLGNGAKNGTGTITLEMAPLGNGAKNGTGTITLEMAPLGNGAKNGTGTMAPLGNGAEIGNGLTRPPGPVGEGTEGTDSAGPVKSPTKKHKKTAAFNPAAGMVLTHGKEGTIPPAPISTSTHTTSTPAVNPAAGMVLTHGKDGTIGHVDVGARSLAKSSQRMVGDRPVGRDSQRSTGDRPMGRDSQRMIGDRPVGRGSVSNIPQGPAGGSNMSYVFESPPGHEMDGISGASSVPRSLGTRSVSNTVARTSNLAPRPYSPPGHEMDGMTRHGSIGFVFESPAGHEANLSNINLAYSGRERPIGRASTTNPALASASAALRADMSDSGRGLNRGSTEQRTLGAGQMSLAAERALAAMDANARNNTGGDRPIGRASVSNLSPAGGNYSDRPLASTSQRPAGSDSGNRKKYGAPQNLTVCNFSDRTLATTSQRPAGSDSVNLKKYGAPPTLTVGPGGGLIRRSTNKSSSSISGKEVLDAESSMKAVIKEETHYQYGVDGVMSSSFGADGLPMAMGDVEEVSVASTDHKMLQEFRARLLTGLKQYYKGKFVEGTLSSDAYKILLFCCDSSHHHHEHPVDLWELAKKEISFGGITQAENVVANKMRKWEIAAKNGKLGKIGGWLVPPLLFLPLLGLSAHLDTIRLVSLETAVELWISLTTSLQTQWLEYSGLYGAMLLDEVQESADGAWGHIVERRIEMPETFQAIQTYRASVSLLSQQKAFILEMSEGGMIEDKESKSIVEIINKRFQMSEGGMIEDKESKSTDEIINKSFQAGPQHQRQSVKAILLGTSFLRGINPKVVDWIRRNCTMKSHKAGECIWEHEHTKDDSSSACVFIVISGVVRMMMQIEDDLVPMYLGSGGVGGVINVVLQDYVPGVSMVAAYAEGNSFGRGPVVLRLPKELFTAMRHYSRDEGLRSYQHLELNLHRTAASNVLDLLRGMVTQQLGTFIRDTMISYLLSEMSHLAKRQRLRTLLREGVHALGLDGDAGVGNQLDWMAELLKMPDDEACALIEDGEIAELEMDEEGYGYLYPWHELLFKAVAAATNSVYDTIRAAVKESVMVVIPPGVSVFQSSTMVLIQGSLLSEEDRMPIIKGESNLLRPFETTAMECSQDPPRPQVHLGLAPAVAASHKDPETSILPPDPTTPTVSPAGRPLEKLRECSQDTPAGPSFISVGALGQPLETLRECSQDTPAGPSFISVGPPVSITQAPDPSSRVSKNASTLMVSSVNPEHQAPSAMVWTSDYFDSEGNPEHQASSAMVWTGDYSDSEVGAQGLYWEFGQMEGAQPGADNGQPKLKRRREIGDTWLPQGPMKTANRILDPWYRAPTRGPMRQANTYTDLAYHGSTGANEAKPTVYWILVTWLPGGPMKPSQQLYGALVTWIPGGNEAKQTVYDLVTCATTGPMKPSQQYTGSWLHGSPGGQ